MLTHVEISNFKAFSELSLALRQLTILTGVNSAGKSSIIQALLLAHEAGLAEEWVSLNGPFGLNLGEALDVLHTDADDQLIVIALSGSDGNERYELRVPEERSVSLQVVKRASSSRRARGLVHTYLSAERLGPRDTAEIPFADLQSGNVGDRGQFTAHTLAMLDRKRVDPKLVHPSTEERGLSVTLNDQTQAWLSSVVRRVLVEAVWLPNVGAATIRFKDLDARAEWRRPSNVGFGLSYALPIIVAGLTTEPGTVLIVENPEAHLHPAGQSQMGRFLARVAQTGVQVIVETHSDHFINGARLAVAHDRILSPDQIAIHFLSSVGPAVEIRTQPSGGLSVWPSGFFDQADIDLSLLARVKRGG